MHDGTRVVGMYRVICVTNVQCSFYGKISDLLTRCRFYFQLFLSTLDNFLNVLFVLAGVYSSSAGFQTLF